MRQSSNTHTGRVESVQIILGASTTLLWTTQLWTMQFAYNTILNDTICAQYKCALLQQSKCKWVRVPTHTPGSSSMDPVQVILGSSTTLLCIVTPEYYLKCRWVRVPTHTPGSSSVDPVQGKLVVTTLAATGCAINLDFFPQIVIHTDDIWSTHYFWMSQS